MRSRLDSNDLSFNGTAPAAVVPDYFTLNGGALRLNSGSVTLNANRGIIPGDAALTGTGTLEVAQNADTLTYAGIMADNGLGADNFAKGGKGILSLTGAATNTYSGSTEVKGGTLKLDFSTNNIAKINPV